MFHGALLVRGKDYKIIDFQRTMNHPIRGGNSEYFDSVVSNGVFVGFVTVVCSPHF
jgi:hypothetical protein